ncbi:hypothetical protein NHG29_04155 [Aerococcaceae bacterium NML160702]|nr:hypothetical protein [Aerococcaceae bacterium NML160702]
MGGRGASIKKQKQTPKPAPAAKKIEQKKSTEPNILFNRAEELKKMRDAKYRQENTPRGAKRFISTLERSGDNLSGVLDTFEPYAIAKWANKRGIKSLDKKSREVQKKVLADYANHNNPKLLNYVNSPLIRWY